jgi:hypothetical protein
VRRLLRCLTAGMRPWLPKTPLLWLTCMGMMLCCCQPFQMR